MIEGAERRARGLFRWPAGTTRNTRCSQRSRVHHRPSATAEIASRMNTQGLFSYVPPTGAFDIAHTFGAFVCVQAALFFLFIGDAPASRKEEANHDQDREGQSS